jgi:DNA ligase-1
MTKITKPMLAGTFEPDKARFPYCVTPKIDGIRFLMVDGVAVSRTFKPIRNAHVQHMLSTTLPNGTDGELTCGETFQSSSSAIMSADGTPDFTCWIFDYVDPELPEIAPYKSRVWDWRLQELSKDNDWITVLTPELASNEAELRTLEEAYLESGFEGAMVRDPNGTYKFGRSTVKENILLKVKRFMDDEAELIQVLEKQHNENEVQYDAFGNTKRSTCQDGMVGANTAGTLVVRNSEGVVFGIGTGLDDAMRTEIWNNSSGYIGRLVKYKYFPVSIKEKPRHPVFLGFRDQDDV